LYCKSKNLNKIFIEIAPVEILAVSVNLSMGTCILLLHQLTFSITRNTQIIIDKNLLFKDFIELEKQKIHDVKMKNTKSLFNIN
jgi:hypothetical protein